MVYVFSIGLRGCSGWQGWCSGLRGWVATMGYADMRGLETCADGSGGGFARATVSMRHRGGAHAEACRSTEAGVASSCGT